MLVRELKKNIDEEKLRLYCCKKSWPLIKKEDGAFLVACYYCNFITFPFVNEKDARIAWNNKLLV